ncbi:phosphotransferase family protein [Acidiferrimicrobium sp. IK]|uniref:phosphotransferase family protein n=1 Tax=Acidiferrimicrobium sp. IK TaxID=2871700 RepID=UPI0021CB5987|nr:phosphotransferase family protein [Acidiferrimicrobium sp. IK]MCU4186863.1 phosphotransferase family protein [Acidiferrimicrobium sp. IK]
MGDHLEKWVAEVTGARTATLLRRPGGGRHQAFDVIVEDGDGRTRELFLRADAGDPPPWEHYTLRRESAIYTALGPTPVPVPQVVALHPELPAAVMEKVDGVARFAGLDRAVQQEILDHFVTVLAALHELDATRLELPGVLPAASVRDAVANEIDVWERRLEDSAGPEPFLLACMRWLRDHNPDVADPPALVQGDTGPGNFLHDGHRVTAVLDWELAHLGDPVEDLAWLATRNSQEPVPDFERFVADYERLAGPVDRARLAYHMVFAEVRIAILAAAREAGARDLLGEVGNGLIYGALHKRLTVEALAAATGVTLPPLAAPAAADAETPQTILYDAALEQLRQIIVPHITDPFAASRAKSLARVLKFLRGMDSHGAAFAAEELRDIEALLGHPVTDAATGRLALVDAVHAGTLDASALLPSAWAAVRREHLAMGGAMGVLASRHLPDPRVPAPPATPGNEA